MIQTDSLNSAVFFYARLLGSHKQIKNPEFGLIFEFMMCRSCENKASVKQSTFKRHDPEKKKA